MMDPQRYSIHFKPNEPIHCTFEIDLNPQDNGSVIKASDFLKYRKESRETIRQLEETIEILKQGGTRPLPL